MSTKKNIDERVIRMLTRQGFIDLFWEELRNARKDNPGITREEVFDSMNEAYAEVFGLFRYADYHNFCNSLYKG